MKFETCILILANLLICLEFIMLKESLKNISIGDLYEDGKFSMRARNYCFNLELYTLYDIVTYYQENNFFKELQKGDRKTSMELDTLCEETLYQSGEKPVQHFPLLRILENELKSNQKRDIDILIHSYPIFENSTPLTNTSLGKKHNISSQRVNQIKNKTYKDFFSPDNPFIQQLKEKCFFYQYSIKENDIMWQDDEYISTLIEWENVRLSRRCILKVLSLLTATHTYIGGFAGGRKDKMWKKSVLIPKKIVESFDFNRFMSDIKHLISINRTDLLTFPGNYILSSPGWRKYKDGMLEEILKVTTGIFEYEFGLPIVEGRVVFPPSDSQQKESDSQQNSDDEVFERTKPRTIGDVIANFLEQHDAPQNIDTITEYTLKHIPGTNNKSIYASLYNDSEKRFMRYGRGCFGLKNNNYPAGSSNLSTSDISKSFIQRVADLEKFILQNWHYPFSVSTDEEEISLNRWWRLQRKNIDLLKKEQSNEIKRITSQYKGFETEKRDYEWNNKCNNLLNFLLINRRLPSPDENEFTKTLYNWYQKVSNDYHSGHLSDEQRRKYKTIEELIQK